MTILERVARNSPEDKIYFGELVEKHMAGEFGELLRLVINGIVDSETLTSRHDRKTPSDMILGRIQAMKELSERLIMCVDEKNKLLEPIESSEVPQD